MKIFMTLVKKILLHYTVINPTISFPVDCKSQIRC